MTKARVELVRTHGPMTTPQGVVDIENNVWLVGDDTEVIIVDASHDAALIAERVGDRRVLAILLTHGHRDHVNAAVHLSQLVSAPYLMHPADQFLWEEAHPTSEPPREIAEGEAFDVAGLTITATHTPGHTPGSVSFWLPELATVLAGDTLFKGGPGATRWEYSSFPTIIDSISQKLLTLPSETTVLPGHGDHTSVSVEQAALQSYIDRGW